MSAHVKHFSSTLQHALVVRLDLVTRGSASHLVKFAQKSICIQDYVTGLFSVLCDICREPVSLIEFRIVADGCGKAVHEDCYVKLVTTPDATQVASCRS